MKIGYVVTQFPPHVTAGLGRYAEHIAGHLAEHHELIVFTINDGMSQHTEQHGPVTVYRPGRRFSSALRRWRPRNGRPASLILPAIGVVWSNWCSFVRLLRMGRAQRPDLIAVHDATNFVCGLLCHYLLRTPIVFHVHTTEHRVARGRSTIGPLSLLTVIERWLGRVARHVVVATPEMRDHLLGAGWNRTPIHVIHLGGTFERALSDKDFNRSGLCAAATELRGRLGIYMDDPVVLFVGRLVRHKGIYELVEAMRPIAAAIPKIRLVIVGDGDRAGVQQTIADHGVDGHVVMSDGFVECPALMEYYEMADACVFPSTFEPFGLVATEALALAKPTILGAGFSRLFLGPSEQPVVSFVPGTAPKDIADAVIALMSDHRLRRTLGNRGEEFVRDQLSWARTANRTLAVYHAAVSGATVDSAD